MFRVGLQLALLHALDDIGQRGVGAAGHPELLALAHDIAVEELDLRAPALHHVLTHRRPLLARTARRVLQPLGVGDLDRRGITLAGLGYGLRRQMQDLLELIAQRLADADRLGAQPG